MARASATAKREPTRRRAPKAVIVHSLDDARIALRAARARGVPVCLRSAPAAAGYAGPGWFRALAEAAADEFPDVRFMTSLDCGAAPGDALAALRAGVKVLRLSAPKRVRDKIVAIARRCGARLDHDRAKALDMQGLADAEAACRAWLDGAGRRPS